MMVYLVFFTLMSMIFVILLVLHAITRVMVTIKIGLGEQILHIHNKYYIHVYVIFVIYM